MKSLVERQVGTRIAKMLQDVQHRQGFVGHTDIARIANHVGEPVRVIQDVVSFFPHYRRTEPPRCRVAICRDMSCRLRGSMLAAEGLHALQQQVGDRELEVHEASCLGRCDRAPAMLVESLEQHPSLIVGRAVEEYRKIVEASLAGKPFETDSDLTTAEHTLRQGWIDCYRSTEDTSNTELAETAYRAVQAYVANPNPEGILGALKTAGLLGMGGAGAPAYSKWDEARLASGEAKYVVCNADESEPGTFKDREILLAAPHLVIEGMIMAGLVSGAEQGYLYIRHEYFEQIERVEQAIAAAEAIGACGSNIFQSGRTFRLEVFISPGGYVCGEQTALVEALEGKRSEPRNRPPELQTNGLYDQPTILNNVETFAWVPSILLRKPDPKNEDHLRSSTPPHNSPSTLSTATESESNRPWQGLWFRNSGTNRAKGRRMFSISGDVRRPGVYEVPCGISFGELLENIAGGMIAGEALQAVALSGPSGGFLPAILPEKTIRLPKRIDAEGRETAEYKYPKLSSEPTDIRHLPMDIDASREIGFMLGAGIVVYGSSADMLDQALACSQFYQRESCGKCVPCRLGSRKLVDVAQQLRVDPSSLSPERLEDVQLLARILRTTSICGLGQVASEPLRTYLRFFHPRTL